MMSNRIGTSYARQFTRPDDVRREKDEAERIERLTESAAAGAERDADERDLLGAANEYLTERTMAAGGLEPLTDEPLTEAIMLAKANAAERAQARTMTEHEKIAAAVVDALTTAGVVSAAEEQEVIYGSEDAEPEDEYAVGFQDDDGTWVLDDEGDTVIPTGELEEDEEEGYQDDDEA